MPFDFLKRKKDASRRARPIAGVGGSGHPGRAVRRAHRRVADRRRDAHRRPGCPTPSTSARRSRSRMCAGRRSMGSGELAPASGLKAVDPYDLILVLAGAATLPPLTDAERTRLQGPQDPVRRGARGAALPGDRHRLHVPRARSPTGCWTGRPRCSSRSWTRPRSSARPGSVDEMDAILVNRFYLRGLEQIDRRTGERPQPLPGLPLGGTSWRDRSR